MSGDVVMLLSNGLRSDPRVEKEARALIAAGRRVTVLAWDREGELPGREQRGEIAIERLGPRASYGRGLASLGAFRAFWDRAAQRAVQIGPRVVHCHDLDTAPAGLRAARQAGCRLVIDLHELYRDSNMVPQAGLVGAGSRTVVALLERRAVRRADAVLVANPGAAEHYRRLGAKEIVIVENAPDHDVFVPRGSPRRASKPLTVGYFGQKRYLEGLETLMRAVQRVPDARAVLAGGGTAAGEVARLAAMLDRVDDSGPFAYEELPRFYEGCDVVYAVYDTSLGNVRTLFPVKVMEAMACGLPSIVAADTWIGDFVEREGVGIAVPAGDENALVDAVLLLDAEPGTADAMGDRGRQLVEAGLNWRSAAGRLVDVYGSL